MNYFNYFILIIQPGKSPITKGPFAYDYVSTILKSVRSLYPDAILSVCELINEDQLWATSEKEWFLTTGEDFK